MSYGPEPNNGLLGDVDLGGAGEAVKTSVGRLFKEWHDGLGAISDA